MYYNPEIEVIDMPDEKEVYGNVNPYSTEGIELFKKWLKDNGVTYYGMPNEDFSKLGAYRQAEVEGNKKLILDNLS